MTLQVPFEQFVQASRRILGAREAFVTSHGSGSLVTCSTSTSRTVVAAITPINPDAARAQLKLAGFETFDGAWSAEGLTDLGECAPNEAFITAVGYISADGRPGVWIDAYTELPSQVQVLRGMFEEFRDTGETADVSFEEFVRLANANVVIVSPSQIKSFLAGKSSGLPGGE